MYNYINETGKYLFYIQTLLEWGGQMICITQLTIHDFMNNQKISTSNS